MAATNQELSPDELGELLSGLTPEIPGYRVLKRIGRGGMSYVYLGVQESLHRQVAIKLIAPEALKDEVSKLRFEKEARTIAKLVHPCIVGIYEVGRTEQGLLYYVLPYLPKGHLRKRDLRENEGAVAEILRALLSALDHAHAHGIVHRDVKAENVLFDSMDRAVLADFGVAVSRYDTARVTGGGLAVGSGGYMAPEQARGERVDGRADLYSLGVLTYEMLTGQLPYRDKDPLALALKHAQDPIPRLPPTKAHWQAFIDRAMAKSPEQRFANAAEMLGALEMVAAMPAPQQPPGITLRLPTLPNALRGPLLAGLGALLVLALAVGFWPSAPSPEPSAGPAPVDAIAPAPQIDTAAGDAAAVEDTGSIVPAVLPPGEQELAAAREQIARGRLSRPPGDNAYDSLLAAHALLPESAEARRLGERWLAAASPHLGSALAEGRDEQALALHERAVSLGQALQLQDSPAWSEFVGGLAAPLKARLEAAIAAGDLQTLRALKTTATHLGIAPAALEPAWSTPIIRARPGESLGSGPSRVHLIRMPAAGRPGLAASPHEVTRAQYAAFAEATGREPARCRVRTAAFNLRQRTWERPGFAQAADHPVVCVTPADALAYAAWLSARDGQRYRLPNAEEWRLLAGPAPAGDPCTAGHIACGASSGTIAASADRAGAHGLRGVRGNAREWLSDCSDGDCSRRLSAGPGWRDEPSQGSTDALEASRGYDDIGFRLVRDVAASEVELR